MFVYCSFSANFSPVYTHTHVPMVITDFSALIRPVGRKWIYCCVIECCKYTETHAVNRI